MIFRPATGRKVRSLSALAFVATLQKFKTTGAKKAEGVSGSIEQTATFKEQGTTVKATLKTDKTYSGASLDQFFLLDPPSCFLRSIFPPLSARFSDWILL
jgi:hypothetical protein